MDEITMNLVQICCSYGALGAVAVYFGYKDFRLNKSLVDALEDFRITLELIKAKVEKQISGDIMGLIYPIAGNNLKITSGFGARNAPKAGASAQHKGIDIAVPVGTKVFASGAGTVTDVGYNNARGNYIKINHGNGIETIYQHLQQANAKKGQTVLSGQSIGTSGNTGTSTGAHLHWEVLKDGKAVNPTSAVGAGGIGGSTSNILGSIGGFDADGVTSVLKSNWLFIIGGLLVLAVLTK